MTAIGSRAAPMRRSRLAPGAQRGQRTGDGEHPPVADRLEERVRHPVRAPARLPADVLEPRAVEEQEQLATAHPPDLARVVEDRRIAPGGPLHAVVLTHR